jgi:hypothetical protein
VFRGVAQDADIYCFTIRNRASPGEAEEKHEETVMSLSARLCMRGQNILAYGTINFQYEACITLLTPINISILDG